MLTMRSVRLLVTVLSGVVLAGGVRFWQSRSEAAEPQKAATERGRLQGRFTAADTGKPVAGAKVRMWIQGVPSKPPTAEALSDADGRYSLELPLGHCSLLGVQAPAGYYTQDPRTSGAILTTGAEPFVVRDFVLQPGSPWHVELHGAKLPADKAPSFWAWPNPERISYTHGEIIMVTGDARGKAVVTIPPAARRYYFDCYLPISPSHYDIPSASLEIDPGFDPRQIKGVPEPLAERKAVRLRDAAGRGAVIEGVEALVEAGQAVLRFHAQASPNASAIALRGAAVDEAGRPVAGARFTAAFYTRRSSAMSHLEATTDPQGKFELRDVLLPPSFFEPGSRTQMMAVKSGFDGAPTKELNLLEVKKTGSGDFGTVILKPGRTLRGKVVDENGRPVHGAVVTNMTNYFLYGHLMCRTDAKGQFVMPDLSYGAQKISAQYGDRSGQQEILFQSESAGYQITVRPTPPTPKSGLRTTAAAAPRPPRPVAPPEREGAWDLTPPLKEPKYQDEPRYALLVFGPKREQRVWMVLDGATLYVDRNGNGDLTEPEKRLEPNNPKDGSNRFGNPGSHTHYDIYDFTVQAGAKGGTKFRLWHWIRDQKYVPKTDLEKKWHAQWLELRH